MNVYLASYMAVAACLYVFLWLIHVCSGDVTEANPAFVAMIDTWWGRMLGSWLWPFVFIFVGWKLYEERD